MASHEPSRRLSPRARWIWRAEQVGIWSVLLVVGVIVSVSVDALGPLWWILPLVGLVAGTLLVPPLRWSRWRWDVAAEGIDIRQGTLTIRRTLVPWVRVQHVDTRRGLLEQGFGLSTVVVHTAAGSHTIPLLPETEAEGLRERIAGSPAPMTPKAMTEPRRLHPAAVAIYSAEALRNAAFPLIVIVAVTVLGGTLDTRALMRALLYGGIGLTISVAVGLMRWKSTTYSVDAEAIHHHTGILSTKDTDVRLARIEAIDVHQGPLQRLFGVFAVDLQTGAAGKGGEISLPALTPEAVAELRAARPQAAHALEAEPAAPGRRLSGRELALAALTAGQLGIVLPVLAFGGQLVQQVVNSEEQGEEAVRLLPHTATAIVAIVVGLIVLAWLLSTLGSVVAFTGFTVTRDGDRLRIRRGLVQRSEATVPVGRVRAVRVVEGVLRRPFGLATLTVEVTGYAEEASAARTLFPLVRTSEVAAFLGEFLPKLADEPLGLEHPPPRAARRYVQLPLLAGAVITAAAWFAVGPWSVIALLAGAVYGRERWRAAAWRLRDGRLAVRSLRMARTTVLAPARFRESHTVAQNVWQRRVDLADLEVAFGKRTTARIRHLEGDDARAAWAAL